MIHFGNLIILGMEVFRTTSAIYQINMTHLSPPST